MLKILANQALHGGDERLHHLLLPDEPLIPAKKVEVYARMKGGQS
jgi:hypothetical protein